MLELKRLDSIINKYDVIFCDVWGVLHNGVHSFQGAVEALIQAKKSGKYVVLVTNSPRNAAQVSEQLKDFSIDYHVYDALVTSGDATRFLLENAPNKIFYIGTFESRPVLQERQEWVERGEAEAVFCTGLFTEYADSIDFYRTLFEPLISRDTPFICANPDVLVEIGDRYMWCAGALADLYKEMGGKVLIAGKPHFPIYDLAFKKIQKISKERPLEKVRILAIGDGLLTDIQGAQNYGIDALFIAGGIHKREYMCGDRLDTMLLKETIERYALTPSYYTQALS